jgi:dolichyl-phosphate-mannose--protein O-mannosyl transferase
MLDIFVSTFSLSSFLLAHFSLSYKDIRRYLFLSLTGLSLGLAFSCKLNGLFCLPALFFLLSPFPLTLRILSLLVIPLLTYISVWEIVREFGGYSWSQIFHAHYVMLTFQSQLREVHPTSAPFWMWVLGKGSVLLFHQHISDSFGSWIFLPIPFWLWLLGIFAAVKEIKGMGKNLLKDFAHLGFWTLWLLWVLSPRPVHSYYFSQSIPFLCLITVRSIGFKGWIFFLWLLSFLWLSPTIYGFPLPLNLGHRLSNPLMGWSPYILSFLTK